LRHLVLVRRGGLVLDLAAGGGRHTKLLLDCGYRVRAVDRDIAALAPLAGPRCTVEQVDLETGRLWPLGGNYDGIIVANYLHRPLFPAIAGALAPGGVVIYETFAVGNECFGRPRKPEFLLRPGELLDVFAAFNVVAFEQGEVASPRRAVVQRIVSVNRPLGKLP
jgi:SAM-dependent methyltransferase